jgi:hypothetical protein
MTPLPPYSTARLWVDYEVGSYNHTLQIRYKAPNTPDDVITAFNECITAVGDLFYASTFVGARQADEGSNVSNPVAGSWPVGWGSGSAPRYASGCFADFVGRSFDGRRARAALFGAHVIAEGGDYRMSSAESTAVAAGVSSLNAAEGVWLSINGFQPIWKNYANLGVNAYWRNHIR